MSSGESSTSSRPKPYESLRAELAAHVSNLKVKMPKLRPPPPLALPQNARRAAAAGRAARLDAAAAVDAADAGEARPPAASAEGSRGMDRRERPFAPRSRCSMSSKTIPSSRVADALEAPRRREDGARRQSG